MHRSTSLVLAAAGNSTLPQAAQWDVAGVDAALVGPADGATGQTGWRILLCSRRPPSPTRMIGGCVRDIGGNNKGGVTAAVAADGRLTPVATSRLKLCASIDGIPTAISCGMASCAEVDRRGGARSTATDVIVVAVVVNISIGVAVDAVARGLCVNMCLASRSLHAKRFPHCTHGCTGYRSMP